MRGAPTLWFAPRSRKLKRQLKELVPLANTQKHIERIAADIKRTIPAHPIQAGEDEGHFHELPGGGYDLQEVAQGLLDNSSPRGEHRERLERIAAGGSSQREPEFSPPARVKRAI